MSSRQRPRRRACSCALNVGAGRGAHSATLAARCACNAAGKLTWNELAPAADVDSAIIATISAWVAANRRLVMYVLIIKVAPGAPVRFRRADRS